MIAYIMLLNPELFFSIFENFKAVNNCVTIGHTVLSPHSKHS
ncbi:hypothetical protein LLB_0596 [Legionella longbeachae D-4968]|nr:hypothetical protein LLB_0596 [Legionella longbeachae D-4968]